MHKILLVEDDLENCEILTRYFSRGDRFTCEVVHDAEAALRIVQQQSIDVILLDIMLPGRDGISLCAELRKSLYCPIVFISCLDDEETIVRALRMGGDDYLTKPFRYPVLLARIEAVLRRTQLAQDGPPQEDRMIGDMRLSIKDHVLKKAGQDIYLSPTEFQLMLYFLNNPNTLLEFEEVFEQVWKRPSYGDLRTVFTHVRNLRKKLEDDPSNPRYILTIPRCGYQFNPKGQP
jgi:DNA-binding response OmpR family regulator